MSVLARCAGGVADQPLKAALADATARPTSRSAREGHPCAHGCPVAGLYTSPKRLLSPGTLCPSTKWLRTVASLMLCSSIVVPSVA